MTFEQKWKQLYEDHDLSAGINKEVEVKEEELEIVECK